MTDTPPPTAPAERAFRHTVRPEAGSSVVLEVEVDADRFTRQADRVFARRNQQARIPGFRPGKAPRAMYERTYGTEHLWTEAAEDLVEETYREIVDVEELSPLERPSVEITQLEPAKPLRYTARVVVRPDVALGDYAAHGAAVEPAPPSDEEIDRTIQAMRESHAQLRSADRASRDGDIVTVDIDVTVEGRPLPPFARNAHLEAGAPNTIVGLAEALVGLEAGEATTVDLAFPASRGEDAAERGGGAELRAAVRNELAHAAFHEARDAAAEKMLDHALATAEVEVPELLVRDELDHMVADLRSRVREQGLSYEQFLLQARKTEDEIRVEWRPAAERRAKSLLVLDAIARKEGVTVSSEELAAQVALTPLAQQDPQALRNPLLLASLARSIRNRKVVDKLIGLASPDAEREAIKKAGGTVLEPHTKSPEIIVPPKSDATPEGREAIRSLLRP